MRRWLVSVEMINRSALLKSFSLEQPMAAIESITVDGLMMNHRWYGYVIAEEKAR